ncbi:MAG: hypothetical protein F9K23_06030 [Bacteroidetes bacterium]|nr:MAG: hypothetical protein F9K23_06030 [Bacteroidota bacterium]
MFEFTFVIAEYVKGNSVNTPIRKSLNICFTAFIAAKLYQQIYGDYTWLDISDYKGILNFFVLGDFIIPLCLVASVIAFFEIFSALLISYINRVYSMRWMKKVSDYNLSLADIEEAAKATIKKTKKKFNLTITPKQILQAHAFIAQQLATVNMDEVKLALALNKKPIEDTIKVLQKAVVAFILAKIFVQNFGWWWLSISSLLALTAIILLLTSLVFLDIIPLLFEKIITSSMKLEKEEKTDVNPANDVI